MITVTRHARGRWAGLCASGLLCALYAHGAWPLGLVLLLPWLLVLDREPTWRATLLNAWLMTLAFTLGGFAWFAEAIAHYTGWGTPASLAVLLLLAPLFQPQVWLSALVRRWACAQLGSAWAGPAWAAAWVAAEWALPRLLGDTLAYGLHAAPLLPLAAAWVGAAGLTAGLLLTQSLLADAVAQRRLPLAAASLLVPACLALPALFGGPEGLPPTAARLRLGLVQSNITDYERLRRELGAGAVARRVLDTHFAMSHDAVMNQQADAVVWSETVYPTSFGNARSEAGAQLDREIQAIVNAAGVPFLFGTYERTEAGEYNVAALLEPQRGLLGRYRKTRLFPFTEALPTGLEWLRAGLPWAGAWLPGDGARVLPLRLRNGREVPIQPLICRDDLDAQLAIDGARLGAQALVTLSNDSGFPPQGAALHLAAAAFRSIETGLPQYRVTPSGYSAVIDARGRVVAGTRWGEQTLVVGSLPVGWPPPTLMVRWGDWVGRAAAALLALLAAAALLPRWQPREALLPPLAPQVLLLSPAVRAATALLRGLSRTSLLAMAALALWGDAGLMSQPLTQLRLFAALCLLPEASAWLLLRACRAQLQITADGLCLRRGTHDLRLAPTEIAAVQPWRLPLPGPGATIQRTDGTTWPHGLAGCNAWALALALGRPLQTPAPSRLATYLRSLGAAPASGWRATLARPAVKFLVLPLLLALPAFRLHQQIAYGSPLGEWTTFGPQAYAMAFGLWWAAWTVGVSLCAAAVRALIEAGVMAGALLRPARVGALRPGLEALGLALLYGGLPAWLVWRVVG